MLKVVGASWLQTRISTYILVAVALLGVGAIILGEFGHVENDGTYSATVMWNHKGGYRIDFWGQGNDLNSIPLNAARAYYKTRIFESGWSIVEIETSAKYPDAVQAYAAGLLEGSLTWQLILHHWQNTVGARCANEAVECLKSMRYLRDNAAIVRERAKLLESSDPFWHMVHLFYTQLDGLEAGWRFAVRRSRQSVEMSSEDFLWLAMASDLPSSGQPIDDPYIGSKGQIFVKAIARASSEPLIAIGHNTAAPYAKMLRLLKRYTFGYHLLPASKTAALVPSRSIVMSSYPGALSSQDEFYLMHGRNRELVVAGTPLLVSYRGIWNASNAKDQVMSPVRVMAANRLATDGRSWSRMLAFQNAGSTARQWVAVEPRGAELWLVEQLPGITHAADVTTELKEAGYLSCTGLPRFREINEIAGASKEEGDQGKNASSRPNENVTALEHLRRIMRGHSREKSAAVDLNRNVNQPQNLAYRGDLESVARPVGVIDTKIVVADVNGFVTFEATSGPARSKDKGPFVWSESFPNVTHVGHPDVFDFESVTPLWAWI